MSNAAGISSLQISTCDYTKYTTDYNQYFDKENCNVHQTLCSQKLPAQPKSGYASALSERMEDIYSQSTESCSLDYDQLSRLDGSPLLSNFLDHTGPTECQHVNTVTQRCTYCKDCGIFMPINGSTIYRDSAHDEKVTNRPEEFYEIMLQNQTKNREYHVDSAHLQYRKTITNWIFQVSQDLKFSPDTTCAVISYVDTILCKVEVSKENLQLVILSCLILAAKFSETDDRVPPLKEAYNLCQGLYSIDTFKKAESFILEQLNWNLKVISPYQFVHVYLSKGCISSTDKLAFGSVDSDVLKSLKKYSECFVNLSMDDYEFNQYLAHVVACSSIASARKLVGITPIWSPELEELTGTNWETIEPCFNKLYSTFEIAFPELANSQKVLVQNKDSQNEFESQIAQICHDNMAIELKETPLKRGCTKVISKNIGSGKKKELPINKKEHKKKNLSRFSKGSNCTENKIQKSDTAKMNIEESNEFFDKSERTVNVKRNLIY